MKKALILAALPFAIAAVPAAAQVTADTETYEIALSGSVDSNCELIPEGSGSYDVNMLNTGNQGALTIVYSCNSPYTVSLTSQNGGMLNTTSGGAVNIDYDVEANFFGFPTSSTNSQTMQGTAVPIVTNNDWQNIATNGGVRSGNLDLSFDSLNEYAVAGDYSDTLTITLAAQL